MKNRNSLKQPWLNHHFQEKTWKRLAFSFFFFCFCVKVLRVGIVQMARQFRKKYPTGYMTVDEFVQVRVVQVNFFFFFSLAFSFQENMALQGGAEPFWREISSNFVDVNDRITFCDFIAGLSSITQGSRDEKLEWMFRLYDVDGNGVLDRNEVASLVRGVMRAQRQQHQHQHSSPLSASSVSSREAMMKEEKDHAEEMFARMDADKNGTVDKKEFVAVASTDPMMVEALATNMMGVAQKEQKEQGGGQGGGEFTTFENQVAGHSTGNMAMLKDASGKTIMKPLAQAEFEFYLHAQKHVASEHKEIFPKFFGRKAVDLENTSGGGESSSSTTTMHYIILEDLTSGLKKPCIMDLKMGFRGHDDMAKTLKVVQQVALCTLTTSSSLGFRLCGMRYHDDTGHIVVRGKPWGAQLKKETMPLALMEFVTQLGHLRFDVVRSFLEGLVPMRAFFASQRLYKFYSSSILFVFDADAPVGKPITRVKLVDFAHTYPNKAGDTILDDNFLSALDNLIEMWKNISSFGEEIWENQRSKSGVFASKNLLASDRPPYSSADGRTALQFSNPNEWQADRPAESDPDGWVYASSWRGPWSSAPGKVLRKRRWIRKVKK